MNVVYDPRTDTLRLTFVDRPVAESDEDKPGVILDYDAEGNVVSMEILDASRRVTEPEKIEFRRAV
jgi:YD repeat-containing protein